MSYNTPFTDPIYGGAPFAYDISDSQLTALIEHSTSAKQQVTFYCKGVLIWNHQNAYAETHAAKFRSFVSNDNVWQGPPGADGAVPNVLSDGCEGNANAVTETTVFELITDSPDYLPVVDIRINDDGNDGEEWGVEYGAVSFQFALRDGTTKPRAGKSCSHILRDFPASPSGTYFIDPNGQRNDDAFQVFCDMANGGWTQINPGGSVPAGDHYDGSDTRIWLSALGISMPWSISDSQLTALQSISSHASQRLFFLCKGVIAWRYDSISTALKLSGAAIWFRSTADSTGIVWTPEDVPGASTYNPSPVVFSDACSMNDGTWRQTEFIFATSNARALPIRDLAAEDHGNDGEEYGANPEPVMFRTDFTVTKLGSTPLNPGRTCADILFASGGSAPDGWYWLDPNGGSPANAVFLECDMLNGGWTGVRPKQRTIPIKQWLGTSGDSPTWFSDTSSGFRMPYNIDSSQLGALQSLSIEGKQSILFLCNGVLAWHSGSSLDGTNALQFRGGVTSDTTWLYNSAETSRPQVNYELDGCRHNDRLASTPFEFHTTLTKALPINDMRVRDAGNSGEVFGAEMGAAIAIGNDHVTKPRTKHIRVRHHFVRELIADGTIVLQHCPGTQMVADALTKALDKQTFEQHLPRLVGTSTAETEQRKAVEGEC
ncbi:hypothetical protein PTSG_11601 [Salpingoeca rosetta]|uniref:Fibrinogen C-terminal domain-containing protein n=1 Tax=Salpingoeca rosetta (strain ATCC 50818 / BSB-021) TaxID=946362 RepID=F2TWR1_SALR5|nr:uncharacterized protein PTSG_11601 [Salpingoeca rosetta]EGD72507.1 hypothetical protein PTSG_11601 [Salpingoeca rosetta]|eukprot:XP_004999076.1 hypothetical protein PTSG_11601 [Salpingoeca rosetta]